MRAGSKHPLKTCRRCGGARQTRGAGYAWMRAWAFVPGNCARRAVVALQGGNPQATVVGRRQSRVRPGCIPERNGAPLSRLQRLHRAGGRIASINVAPALAIGNAEREREGILLGLVAGYELEVRLRDAIAARVEGWAALHRRSICFRGGRGKIAASRLRNLPCACHCRQQRKHLGRGSPRR
jgi:hypothetical protein